MLVFWILAVVFLTAMVSLIYMMKNRVVRPVYIIISTLVCVTMVIFAIVTLPENDQQQPEPEPTAETATDYVSDDLVNNGGSNGSDVVFNDDVDESKDTSTTGDAGVNKDGFKTVDQVVNWLSSDSAEAEKTIIAIISLSGATREDVLNPANWVRVQSLVDFTYRGNNGLDTDGNLIDMGERTGDAGDIFFAFVSPTTPHSVVYLRGACGNVQLYTPWLQPKNPADDVPAPQGVTQLPANNTATDGNQSSNQQAVGQVSGNAIDNTVDSNTTSDETTSDTGEGVVIDGTTTSDDSSAATKVEGTTTYNNGGVSGNTHITDPDAQ